ncbi:hypothetical protein C1H46_010053 [Malus baccata]|uniref:Choline transporter-like protein n=1 Tax=Malus baccata TaxID=106549 RepID=A0A540MZN2_MALBA|nr:hypothetical protein C1H46_010053 [Malus baccata]
MKSIRRREEKKKRKREEHSREGEMRRKQKNKRKKGNRLQPKLEWVPKKVDKLKTLTKGGRKLSQRREVHMILLKLGGKESGRNLPRTSVRERTVDFGISKPLRYVNRVMASLETTKNIHIQVQEAELRPSSINLMKTQEPSNFPPETTTAGQFLRRLFKLLFYLHLILITIFVIFFTLYGLIFNTRTHHFRPLEYYPPLLTAIGFSAIFAFIWQWMTSSSPSKAFKAAFWLSPLLTCAVGVLLIDISSPASLAAGVVAIVCAVIQSLYACWVSPRFDYAIRVLSVSTAFPPLKTTILVIQSISVSILYSCLLVSGIGRATATRSSWKALFIALILLSMAWTMQVIKNTLLVTVSRIKYMNLAFGTEIDTREAFRDTIKHLTGSICIGSILVPVLGVVRGSSRAVILTAGDTDEFLFSCANCYSGMASTLVMHGNRWGFVHVGAYNKGFVQASSDTWEMFGIEGLKELIDSDLTGSFCFLSGVAAGAICSLAHIRKYHNRNRSDELNMETCNFRACIRRKSQTTS